MAMAENGRKDVFRARSGEKPTGQTPTEKKGMEMEEEEICIADIAAAQQPRFSMEGAKNGSEKGAQFMRFILTSGHCIPSRFTCDEAAQVNGLLSRSRSPWKI